TRGPRPVTARLPAGVGRGGVRKSRRSATEPAMKTEWGVFLVAAWRRAATLVVSPTAAYSMRRSEPTRPDMTGPLLRPTPRERGAIPRSASQALKRGRRTVGRSSAAAAAVGGEAEAARRGAEA